MMQINYLLIASLLGHALLHAAAHPERRISTSHIPGTSTCSWSEDNGHVRRTIEDLAQAVVLINTASLPPHAHKVMTIASQPHCAQYLLLAMQDRNIRDKMLETLDPHLQKPLNLKKAYELFGTQVASLKNLPFFVALFTFSIETINKISTTLWMLEMGNEQIMLDPPINSASEGFSREYVSDPSIFLVNPHSLHWQNLHKRPALSALMTQQTADAKKRLAQEIKTLVEAPEKPFGFKIRTNVAKLYLVPTYDTASIARHPIQQDGCSAACTTL